LLEHAADMDPTAAGYAIGNLLDLKAVEAIDTIRQAFRLDAVDISIAGDLEDVEIDLGLRERRITPRPYYPLLPGQLASMEPSPGASVANSRQDFEEQPRPVKIGRNEPCPCGSGRKYKKCCLA
jgi:preprotein translocase subunit SecA